LALDYLHKALVSLMPTQAVRIVLDEHPLIWEMLDHLSQSLIKNKQGNNELIQYIQSLQSMSDTIESNAVQTVSHVPNIEFLTKRELQILQKVSEGCTDIELAAKVFLSVNTVKWHLRNIYNKLEVRSRLEAVTEAKKLGLIS